MDNNLIWLIRAKQMLRLDAKYSELSTRLPYALCKEVGIDTTGMEPHEAWDAWNKKTGGMPKDALDKAIESARKKLGITPDPTPASKPKKAATKPKKAATTTPTPSPTPAPAPEPETPVPTTPSAPETTPTPEPVPESTPEEPTTPIEPETKGKKIGDFSAVTNEIKSDVHSKFVEWRDKMDSYYGSSYPEELKSIALEGRKIVIKLDKLDRDITDKELSDVAEVVSDIHTKIADSISSTDWTGHKLRKENADELKNIFDGVYNKLKDVSEKVKNGEKYEIPKGTAVLGNGSIVDIKCKTLSRFVDKINDFRSRHRAYFVDPAKEKKVQDNLQKIFDNADFCSTINSEYVGNVLTEHFKCLHETGHGDGYENPKARRQMSEYVFGTPKGTSNSDMEKYGYLIDKGVGWSELTGGVHYGGGHGDGVKVCLIFKKDNLKDRTTYSSSDSLATRDSRICGMVDTKCSTDGLSYGSGYDITAGRVANGTYNNIRSLVAGHGYVEAQYHGMVTANDIESIKCRNRREAAELVNRLNKTEKDVLLKNGIKVFYDDSGWEEYEVT